MTNTRRSSGSQAAAATENASSTTESPEVSNGSPSAVDSTHQAAETVHEKEDQKLEANDPDLLASNKETTEPSSEASTTPINNAEVQETDPARSQPAEEIKQHELEHKEPLEQPITDGSTRGADRDVLSHKAEADAPVDPASAAIATDSQENGSSENDTKVQYVGEEHEVNKHAKRPVEQDSNTLAEEAQDYSAGAYKSPFRHTHKAEKAGKEER
ncbi:hypothetical protein BX616_001996 [Lobosporangium transversale]|uniref:Uncharacterized protein n=1 Tax=Lobosporangium transversale TaxID=64571 RepID=A0A1Y2GZT6_9FUNG|nr:hypothetical protein BCR41DRAFT_345900 [Lobosporangium transversale]KAF9902238.1 hypothetical protein BX616_001996 [Lobosporangium transversale]ORZ27786.1 hypothetical protein BCR41DRAFT_345900 [Lobosporangium transversale]|eukprot:XP_021885489.1 hypothetical protein BCR41DRAFT_345900 [Lobosporangium transversale]